MLEELGESEVVAARGHSVGGRAPKAPPEASSDSALLSLSAKYLKDGYRRL